RLSPSCFWWLAVSCISSTSTQPWRTSSEAFLRMGDSAIPSPGRGKRVRTRADRYFNGRTALANLVRGTRDGWAPGREFWALRDVSFEIVPGEVVGIVGSNGAGKSTMLKLLSRITRPSEGWAGVRGRVGSLLR